MQPLVPYLLGEPHPQGKRLANVQNCFRAQDIDEAGDNRHTTFFRMLGNWSLGDYFKKEQLSWFFEFLTKELGLSAKKLYVSVFEGYQNIPRDEESETIWKGLFEGAGINSEDRIYYYGAEKNWWSRAGEPEKMPSGEPGNMISSMEKSVIQIANVANLWKLAIQFLCNIKKKEMEHLCNYHKEMLTSGED
ncbi:MAG: hypothetical protein HYU49_02300 [Candidatus Levybacteria bacterium]|nr:hypothetical protein [Candidatus Levybacteria bacterium]